MLGIKEREELGVRSDFNDYIDDKDFLFKSYFNDVKKYPLLTREEEDELTRLAKLGDQTAKERLINANLRFVVSVAKKYQNQGLPLMDLIAEGNVGLLTAIEKFDPDMGYHFISYAVWWIRQSILKALSEKTKLIRLPLNKMNDLLHIERIIEEAQNKGKNLDSSEIAMKLGISKETVEEVLSISRDYLSFDYKLHNTQDSSTLGEIINDEKENPEENFEKSYVKDIIDQVLDTLTEREKKIIKMRFGLDNNEPLSLQEIGKEFKLTKERIRQIEKKALRKLKHPSRTRKLKALLAA